MIHRMMIFKGEEMERYSVSSSNISSIGYELNSGTLEIEFTNGSIYQYYGVPENIYDSLMRESSKGKFFNIYIKNAFPYSRV